MLWDPILSSSVPFFWPKFLFRRGVGRADAKMNGSGGIRGCSGLKSGGSINVRFLDANKAIATKHCLIVGIMKLWLMGVDIPKPYGSNLWTNTEHLCTLAENRIWDQRTSSTTPAGPDVVVQGPGHSILCGLNGFRAKGSIRSLVPRPGGRGFQHRKHDDIRDFSRTVIGQSLVISEFDVW